MDILKPRNNTLESNLAFSQTFVVLPIGHAHIGTQLDHDRVDISMSGSKAGNMPVGGEIKKSFVFENGSMVMDCPIRVG